MSPKHPSTVRRLLPSGAVAALAAAGLVAGLVGPANAVTGFSAGVTRDHKPSWGTNRLPIEGSGDVKSGRVWDTLTYGDVSYIAGEFSSISPVISGAGALDGASGLPAAGFPTLGAEGDTPGDVKIAVPDGLGGWYVGGTFTDVNNVSRDGMARIAADGTLDTSWAPELAGVQEPGKPHVHAMSLSGPYIYLGGEFTKFAGEGQRTHNRIARVSASTGSLDRNWNPDADGPVRAVAAAPDQGRTYIAGDFATLKGGTVAAPGLAAVDSAGNVAPWNPAVGAVRAIAVSPDSTRVYTGGDSLAAVDAASGAVLWSVPGLSGITSLALRSDGGKLFAGGGGLTTVDTATGAVDPAWNLEADGGISTVSVSQDGTRVFVGGSFTTVRGHARQRLAALDAATGTLDAWDPNADGDVSVLSVSGSQVYAGGAFGNLGALSRTMLGAIDARTGGPADWAPRQASDELGNIDPAKPPVALALALSADASKIYVGGNFSHVLAADGVWLHRENLAAVDRVTGLADPGFNPGRVQGTVRGLAMYGNTLYAGGDFASVRVSRSVQGEGRPDNPCPPGADRCRTLTNSNGNPNGSVEWDRPGLIAAFDATTGFIDGNFDETPASAGPGLIGQTGKECKGSECGNGAVKSIGISADGRYLYAGGTFSDLGGQLGMFAVNRADGSFTSWQPEVDIPVFGLTMGPDGQSVVTAMGGAGGRHKLYRPHTNDGEPVWSVETDGDATSVGTSGTTIYGGGHYDNVRGLSAAGEQLGDRKRKHAVALSFGGVVADNFDPVFNTNEGVFTVEVVSGRMVIYGGNFSEVGIRVDKSGNPDETQNTVRYKAQPGFAMFHGNP